MGRGGLAAGALRTVRREGRSLACAVAPAVALACVGAAVTGCGLALGIDDIPPVKALADAADAPVRDARGDVGRDAPVDAPVDVQADAGLDAPPTKQVPARSGTPTTSSSEINFAVHQLWMGDTDPTSAFTPDPGAWATFGYNIDGKVTTSVSTDVCTLAPNAATTVQIDGNDGADDSFGENVVSFLSLAFNGLSQSLSGDITNGHGTVLLDTTGLSSDPAQTNVGLTAAIYGGAPFTGTPTFTLADSWPIDPSSLADGRTLASGPKLSLSDSYVVGGTWVSGHPTDFVFSLIIGHAPIAFVVHQAVITFQHTLDDAGASHAAGGIVSGVLRQSEMLAALDVAAASSGSGDCSFVGVIAPRFAAAQDIMQDGTNPPGQPCNAISVAFAFTADEIQPPSVVGPSSAIDGGVPHCITDAAADAPAD